MVYGSCGKTVTKGIAYQSKRTKSSLAQLTTDCASYSPIRFHLQIPIACSKQKLTNFMCNINHPKFPCKACAKNIHDKDKAVQFDFCELWIHIECNNLNYLDYRYCKAVMNPGIAQNVAAQFFHLTPYQATKTSWLVVLTLTVTSQVERSTK